MLNGDSQQCHLPFLTLSLLLSLFLSLSVHMYCIWVDGYMVQSLNLAHFHTSHSSIHTLARITYIKSWSLAGSLKWSNGKYKYFSAHSYNMRVQEPLPISVTILYAFYCIDVLYTPVCVVCDIGLSAYERISVRVYAYRGFTYISVLYGTLWPWQNGCVLKAPEFFFTLLFFAFLATNNLGARLVNTYIEYRFFSASVFHSRWWYSGILLSFTASAFGSRTIANVSELWVNME